MSVVFMSMLLLELLISTSNLISNNKLSSRYPRAPRRIPWLLGK